MDLEEPLETEFGRGFHPDDDILDAVESLADEIGWEESVEHIDHDDGGFAVAFCLMENELGPDTINWLKQNDLVVAWRDTDPRRYDDVYESELKDYRRGAGFVADTLLIMPERGATKRKDLPDEEAERSH